MASASPATSAVTRRRTPPLTTSKQEASARLSTASVHSGSNPGNSVGCAAPAKDIVTTVPEPSDLGVTSSVCTSAPTSAKP